MGPVSSQTATYVSLILMIYKLFSIMHAFHHCRSLSSFLMSAFFVKSVAEGTVASFLLATIGILNLSSSIGAGKFSLEVSLNSFLL